MAKIDFKNIKHIRIAGCLLIAGAYAFLWIIPSNIGRLIARDRDILLGRYSLERMTLLLLLPLIIAPFLYLFFAPDKKRLKIRIFQFIAFVIIFIPGLFIVDVVLRLKNQTHYVETDKGFHRPPNQKHELTVVDKPEKAGRFQKVRPGYPAMKCTLTVDSMGFRNTRDYETCDIIALGDSFVEGSDVTDSDTWPAVLSKLTGKTVCNLGMSGTDPMDYYDRFKKVGLQKKPKILICMIYEGNDFNVKGTIQQRLDALKHGRSEPLTFSRRLRKYRKSSPVILGIRHAILYLFTPSVEDATVEPKNEELTENIPLKNGTPEDAEDSTVSVVSESDASESSLGIGISWLPVKVPASKNGRYYHFPPKRMLSFYRKKAEFANSTGWKCAEFALLKLKDKCDKNGIKMFVVFAPAKPHVIIPLVRERISPEVFHAFAKLKDRSIPDAETFTQELFDNMNVVKNQISNFCKNNDIGFIDPAGVLRSEMAIGNQVYFTYDQHWTPSGHRVTAEAIAEKIKK